MGKRCQREKNIESLEAEDYFYAKKEIKRVFCVGVYQNHFIPGLR